MVNKNNGPSRGKHNNEVTYADKWDTKKNRRYKDMAMDIAKRSDCASSIPLSWAREVYFFLHMLDTKFGIQYSTKTHMGWYYPKTKEMLLLLFVVPIISIPRTIKQLYKDIFGEPSKWRKRHTPTKKLRVRETLFEGKSAYFHGYQILWHRLYGYFYNKTKGPQISLGQFKEKFGYLTVYYDAPDDIKPQINKYIKALELGLLKKGAYHNVTTLVKQRNTNL